MNKNLLALLGIAPVLTPLHTLANDRPDPRPNIIFFLVDDMDGRTLHCLSGQRKPCTTNVTKPLTWSVWPVRE